MKLLARDIFSDAPLEVTLDGNRFESAPSAEAPTEGLFISPGWVDIQVNGFAGYDLNAEDAKPEDVQAIVRRLWREGVTTLLPTVITGASSQIEHCLGAIANACAADEAVAASIAGIHLEGPYLSPEDGARGAHPEAHVRPADWAEFERFQHAAEGRIRLVTLAPETPGAIPFIRKLVAKGVVVALGHTLATGDNIAAAIDAGARLSTHLGNGIPAMLPRHPNPVWEQLADDRLYASAIFDGCHLPSSVMRVLARVKGKKLVLTSDAVALAGMPPGVYDAPVGGRAELHADGRLTMYGTDYLAGSASALPRGIENAVRLAGCSWRGAVRTVTLTPAELLGLNLNGQRTLFRWDSQNGLEVLATVVADRVIFRSRALDNSSGRIGFREVC